MTRIGRMMLGMPLNCRIRWMLKAVWLWRKRVKTFSSSKTCFPTKNTARRYLFWIPSA